MPFLNPLFSGGLALAFLIGLAALAFNIWMLVDVVKRPETDFAPPASRVWWIVGLAVGLLLGWLGLVVALLYFFLIRKPVREGKPPAALFGGGGGAATPGSSVPRGGRHCTNCGQPLGTHARFCQNCGTSVEED